MPHFTFDGNRIVYEVHGYGDRVLVLSHGLLLNRGMYSRLAPEIGARGYRVVTVDLLGHGQSDRPPEMVKYSTTHFARQVIGLLDHLGLEQAVIGGTSLGANVSLEVAHLAPERVKAMVIEMPVLDNALLACSVIFTPILVWLRFGAPVMKALAKLTNRIPRTNELIDIGLDWIRRDPEPSSAVLEGLFLGRVAPHHDERVRMEMPAMVIGHRADPLHPFSDSGMLAEELPNAHLVQANSILEWRLKPERLDDELTRFLDAVFNGGGWGDLDAREATAAD